VEVGESAAMAVPAAPSTTSAKAAQTTIRLILYRLEPPPE
jgi:hypothetical protein